MAEQVYNDTKINVEFEPTATRQGLVSGENLSRSLGKISKIINDLDASAFDGVPIFIGTKEYWDSQKELIGQKGSIYIYEDYFKSGEHYIPNIKISDGKAYLIDNPFITTSIEDLLNAHIEDEIKHITATERAVWNNKVRCYIDEEDSENIIFTTD